MDPTQNPTVPVADPNMGVPVSVPEPTMPVTPPAMPVEPVTPVMPEPQVPVQEPVTPVMPTEGPVCLQPLLRQQFKLDLRIEIENENRSLILSDFYSRLLYGRYNHRFKTIRF
jgi:hypothetical protein